MITFTIDTDNNITAFASRKEAEEGKAGEIEYFSSEKELGLLAAQWPMGRLVETWNSLSGVIPVKRFTDRKKAVARIWKGVQQLKPAVPAQSPDVAPFSMVLTKVAFRRRVGLLSHRESRQFAYVRGLTDGERLVCTL
jgi:hypothetical protein